MLGRAARQEDGTSLSSPRVASLHAHRRALFRSSSQAVAITTRSPPPYALDDAAFYRAANAMLLGYDGAPNAVHYFVAGEDHTYTNQEYFYTVAHQ